MVYDGILEGKYVILKSCGLEDAAETLAIRNDPNLTRYLPRLDITIDQQRDWIRRQRERDGDYFFVVRTADGRFIGTVSVYDIQGESSESGRLALVGNAMENTEASMLLFRFAFNTLNLQEVRGYIMDGNKRAERFNTQFGCVTGEPERTENGDVIRRTRITRESFHQAETKLKKVLYRSENRI